MNAAPRVSIVVPFYNEADSIRPLYVAVVDALGPTGYSFEMVFVDDGSRDNTVALATEIARSDPRVRVVQFRRNAGQTAAMAAGMQVARGEIIVTMDGDLQNDPRDVPLFLEKIAAGYDLVVGWRANRQDKLVSRKIPSRIANWLIAKVTGVSIRDNGCSLKAYRAALIRHIPLYSEMHRFIPAMASLAGPRIAEIRVRHHARKFGESKYGLSRVYKVLLDLMVIKTLAAFSARPMLWFTLLALPMTLLGGAILTYALATSLARGTLPPLPLVASGLVFIASSFLMIGSGALAELIYRLGDVREQDFARLTGHIDSFTQNPPNFSPK